VAAGYKSNAVRWIGGAAAKPLVVEGGYRSMQCWWLGGACTSGEPPEPPLFRGGYQLLAFWMGGGHGYRYFTPSYYPTTPLSGPGFTTKGARPFNDDEEIFEFLKIWVVWNDIE
jgi:hypothetical protein